MDISSSTEREEESEKEKEFTGRDDKSVQQTQDTTQLSISNNVQVKPRRRANAKNQKVNSMTVQSKKEMDAGCVLSTQNSAKQAETKPDGSTGILHCGTTHMVPPVGNDMPSQPNFAHGVGTWMAPHSIGYGYGTPNHGMTMHPFYGLVPCMPQFPQVTIPPHVGGGHSNLLRQVMNNGSEASEKSGQPTQLR
ncbi:uncharacterized protein LOC130735297 isoform X2 [Lotus japonicus]|uniref:uncharacterized protein LOC130735297 isoform X2 n=1 Tax=Lotus japonicus TaxID=34305 RepID=UPI0025850729|nr:uncharacterized protein LOC130735297 isoform X2 [Lotus japonicus]